MAYAETPRTDAGNATYLSNGHLENFSVEQSLLSPLKRRDDIASQMRSRNGISLKTPRARVPFSDRRNLPAVPGRGEFTPLLHSVAKKNLARTAKLGGVPETPAFLKAGHQGTDSPALPAAEASPVYVSELGSSVLEDNDGTPMPQVASSSAQSTPLAQLPKRDPTGVLNDQGNLMTLREQENIINKIEKENFGLKLKIHFLEESLKQATPGLNEAALKENTELKVDRVTLHKELARCRKTLSQAERDVEDYRRRVAELHEQARHEDADEGLRQELEDLRHGLAAKEAEAEDLRHKLDNSEDRDEELERLRDDIEDLQADLRQKDRLIDERDEELEKIKAQASKELDEVYAELETEKKRAQELEARDDPADESKLQEMHEELQEALEAKQKAEEDLEELRDEISNKSINTKGLSGKLEEKADKLQNDLTTLREKHKQLQTSFDDKSRQLKKLEDDFQEVEQDADVRDQRLRDQNELLRHEHDSVIRKYDSLTGQYKQAIEDLQRKSEEKDLLHSRHDALTSESQDLQKDLSKAQYQIRELERGLEDERQHAEENDQQLRSEAKAETTRLSEQINALHREFADRISHFDAAHDVWESKHRGLQSLKERAEEQAAGLQRTIDKLQKTEGTLSSQEQKLKEALESEKHRHLSEEAVLERRVEDLNNEIKEKRVSLEDLRSELSQVREELRLARRDQAAFEEKVQSLEDEVEVLQNGLDEEAEKAKEAESLRHHLATAQDELAKVRSAQYREHKAGSNNINSRLHAADEQLYSVNAENKSLQDRLVTTNIELQKFQALSAELEAKRDEMRSDMTNMRREAEFAHELSAVHRDLTAVRKKETEYVQREAAQKDVVKELKQKVTQLERQVHEAEIARLATSPRSSVGDSARKNELVEMQRQLANALQQLKETRAKSKEDVKILQRKLSDCEKQIQDNLDSFEQQREQLEADVSSIRREQEALISKNTTATQTISRLRNRISSLEQDLRAQRQGTTADDTIAEERKDLHEMLKDAKLQAEDLQVQITSRETSLAVAATREKDLRSQLRRIREDRNLETRKASALSTELNHLQKRHERAVEAHSRHQRNWEEEKRSMVSRVRFPNNSISTLETEAIEKLEQRHAAELRGLAKQIQWLRAKCQRQEGFRVGLVYEKKYLMMQIEMFEACNKIDLSLLREIGIHPPKPKPTTKTNTNSHSSTRLRLGDTLRGSASRRDQNRKIPSIRTVGVMFVAIFRMRKMADEWAGQKRVREALGRKMELRGKGKEKGRRGSGRG